MTQSTLQSAAEHEVCCPTCNARQTWSDQCRRCKCDLSLLRRVWQLSEAERQRCLRQLRAGRPHRALPHARRYATIMGATEASRLLAVCHLLCNNWPAASVVGSPAKTPCSP